MKRSMMPVVGLVIGALTLPASAQQADDVSRRPIPAITVNGNGDVRVAPDEATVRLGVTRQAQTAKAAQEQVNETAQAILAAVTKLGIKREQIQTSRLNLFPVYAPQAPQKPEEPRIVAYRASNIVSVRLSQLDQVGPVIDAGLKAGSNQLEGVFFTLRDDQAAREQALEKAVLEAKRKANTIAQALGVRLSGILQVDEGGVSIQPPMYMERAAMAMARGGGDAATPVSPGEVTVNASVTIRYRIDEARR